jgi:hypothetical protein
MPNYHSRQRMPRPQISNFAGFARRSRWRAQNGQSGHLQIADVCDAAGMSGSADSGHRAGPAELRAQSEGAPFRPAALAEVKTGRTGGAAGCFRTRGTWRLAAPRGERRRHALPTPHISKGAVF